MKFIFFVCLGLLLLGFRAGAQSMLPSFRKEECKVQLFKLAKGEVKKQFKRISEENVVVSFNEGFSDSLYCYIDDVLYLNSFVKSDSLGRGYSCASINVDFRKLKRSKIDITIILPESKIYTSFKIDRKYALIKVHRLGGIWYVIKTNYIPEYQ